MDKLNFLCIDIYDIFMLYHNQEKVTTMFSLPTRAASALPCFWAFPAIATEHPLCRIDEEPGIGQRHADISESVVHPFLKNTFSWKDTSYELPKT